jgi:hypothetical protein
VPLHFWLPRADGRHRRRCRPTCTRRRWWRPACSCSAASTRCSPSTGRCSTGLLVVGLASIRGSAACSRSPRTS